MITLYQYPPVWGLPSSCPFGLKAGVFMKMISVPFRIKYVADVGEFQSNAVPYIMDKGTKVCGANAIITHLSKHYQCDLDNNISAGLWPVMHALQRMLEDHLYWVCQYSRWVDESYWQQTYQAFFSRLPEGLKIIVPAMARDKMRTLTANHHMMQDDAVRVYEKGVQDIIAISTYLADKKFIMGSLPTSLDASVYALLESIMSVPIDSPLKQAALSSGNLQLYCNHIKSLYYSNHASEAMPTRVQSVVEW